MVRGSAVALTCVAALTCTAADASAQTGGELDFFIGDWDVTSVDSAGNVVGRARTSARWILDETTIQDDYYGLDPAGNVVFRGTSLRTFDPNTRRWIVHWAMANQPGYTYIDARWEDGELHGDGRGFDGGGEFVERYRYYDITPTSYSFALWRSYDGGETWAAYPEIRARKR
jgi:hypothetical protein